MTTSTTDVGWLDKAATDTLISSAHKGDLLNLKKTDNFVDGSSSTMVVVVVNRTGGTLAVADLYTDGDVAFEPKGDLVPPPTELGAGSSAFGVWQFRRSGMHHPGAVLKFSPVAETGNQPVYVGGNVVTPFLRSTREGCAVGAGEVGDAHAFFTTAFEGDVDSDHELTVNQSISGVAGSATVMGFDADGYSYIGATAPRNLTVTGPPKNPHVKDDGPMQAAWWVVLAYFDPPKS